LARYSRETEDALEAAEPDTKDRAGLFVTTRWVQGEYRDSSGLVFRQADHTAIRTDVTPVAMHEGAPAFVAFMEEIGRLLGGLPGAYEVGVHQGSRGAQREYRPHAYVVRRLAEAGR
jgi:hypothetical protein